MGAIGLLGPDLQALTRWVSNAQPVGSVREALASVVWCAIAPSAPSTHWQPPLHSMPRLTTVGTAGGDETGGRYLGVPTYDQTNLAMSPRRGLSTDGRPSLRRPSLPSILSLTLPSQLGIQSYPRPGPLLLAQSASASAGPGQLEQTGIGNRLSPCPERRRAPPYIHCFLFLLLFLYAPLQSLSPHLQLAVLRRLSYKFTCSIYRLTTGRLAFALGLGLSHPDWSPPNVVSPLPEGQEP